MIAKKKEGEMPEESEQQGDAEQAQGEAAGPEDQQKMSAPQKTDAAERAEVAVKADTGQAKAQAKPKPKVEAQASSPGRPAETKPPEAKPTEAKSLAEVMKFDLKIRRRPRF